MGGTVYGSPQPEREMEHANGIENELIEGRNAITEALRAGRPIDKLFIVSGDGDRTLGFIAAALKKAEAY